MLRRNCLLKHVTEGKREGARRGERRHKQLLDNHKQKRRYWNFKEETFCTFWRGLFGRGYGSVARYTMK
jgi:hypothetical protein